MAQNTYTTKDVSLPAASLEFPSTSYGPAPPRHMQLEEWVVRRSGEDLVTPTCCSADPTVACLSLCCSCGAEVL